MGVYAGEAGTSHYSETPNPTIHVREITLPKHLIAHSLLELGSCRSPSCFVHGLPAKLELYVSFTTHAPRYIADAFAFRIIVDASAISIQ